MTRASTDHAYPDPPCLLKATATTASPHHMHAYVAMLPFPSHGPVHFLQASDPWMLPAVRARLVYCLRLSVAIGLTSAWSFVPGALDLFVPNVLVALAAVSPGWIGLEWEVDGLGLGPVCDSGPEEKGGVMNWATYLRQTFLGHVLT